MSKPLQTIPSRYYTDPEYYRIEKGKIFYCTWQFACHETDIAEPGAYRPYRSPMKASWCCVITMAISVPSTMFVGIGRTGSWKDQEIVRGWSALIMRGPTILTVRLRRHAVQRKSLVSAAKIAIAGYHG